MLNGIGLTWPRHTLQPSLSHLLVLISSDSHELSFTKYVRAEAVVSLLQSDGLLVVRLDNVDSRLVLVHGVEDELETKSGKDRTVVLQQGRIDSRMLYIHTYIISQKKAIEQLRVHLNTGQHRKLKPLPKKKSIN